MVAIIWVKKYPRLTAIMSNTQVKRIIPTMINGGANGRAVPQ
jgi:hypothetical protein